MTERLRTDEMLVFGFSGRSRHNIIRLCVVLPGTGLIAGLFAYVLPMPWKLLPLLLMAMILWSCVASYGMEVLLELNKADGTVQCAKRVFGITKKYWSGTMADVDGVELREVEYGEDGIGYNTHIRFASRDFPLAYVSSRPYSSTAAPLPTVDFSQGIACWLGCEWRYYDRFNKIVESIPPGDTAAAEDTSDASAQPQSEGRVRGNKRTDAHREVPAMRLSRELPGRLVFTYRGPLLLLAVAAAGGLLAWQTPQLALFFAFPGVPALIVLRHYFLQSLHLEIDKHSGTLKYAGGWLWRTGYPIASLDDVTGVELRYENTQNARKPRIFIAVDGHKFPPLRVTGRGGPEKFSRWLAACLGCEWRSYYSDGRIRESVPP